jgi:murein DD-endopeptidase MepM/ murein hydrolase activator NlpD
MSEASAAAYLASLSGSSSTSSAALLDALRPLQDYGLTADQVMATGMGRFPVAGLAYFRDDFGEPRTTPTPHPHQGNDIFTAFDTPVRSPADGVLTYQNELVGGLSAYVTEPDGTWYYLCHLKRFSPDLAGGAHVQVGQIVGFAGDTGDAQGGPPHVHFEIHPHGGAAVDPYPQLTQWLSDALANVPALLAPYREPGGGQAMAAVAVTRHIDQTLSGDNPSTSTPPPSDPYDDTPAARQLANALVGPLTPSVLQP